MKLIPKIRERRMEKHMSQKELCEKLSISQSQLSHIEKGRYTPSLKSAFEIAFKIGCKVDDLYEIEE